MRYEVQEAEIKIDELLSVRPERAAKILDISKAQLYILMSEGQLPYVKRGSMRLLPVDGLRAWLRDDAKAA